MLYWSACDSYLFCLRVIPEGRTIRNSCVAVQLWMHFVWAISLPYSWKYSPSGLECSEMLPYSGAGVPWPPSLCYYGEVWAAWRADPQEDLGLNTGAQDGFILHQIRRELSGHCLADMATWLLGPGQRLQINAVSELHIWCLQAGSPGPLGGGGKGGDED